MKELQSKRVIFAEAYIKAGQIRDRDFHSVYDDIYELAKQYSDPKNGDLTKTCFCEHYYVDRLPRQKPFDCGGYVYPKQ
jgi:hypothetical protein